MRKLLAMGLLLTIAHAHADAGTAAQALTSFYAALTSGDKIAAASVLADDVLIFESGYVERSKSEYLKSHLDEDIDFAKATHRILLRQSEKVSRALAIIESETETAGRFHDKDVHFFGTETAVLVLSNGRWVLQHMHWSSRQPK